MSRRPGVLGEEMLTVKKLARPFSAFTSHHVIACPVLAILVGNQDLMPTTPALSTRRFEAGFERVQPLIIEAHSG